MESRLDHADVAVIGGGPGGSAAAITCARRGLSVILLERDEIYGERPGETMHPGVRPILEQLGLGDRIDGLAGALHSGIWVQWGGPSRFEPYGADESGPWQGFQVWRPDFDGALLELAASLGVRVCKPRAVKAVVAEDGRIRHLETKEGPVSAKIFIDASGRSRHLARQLGVSFPARSPRLIARYGYVTGSCPRRDVAPAIVGDRSGWTWTAKIRDDLYQWTRVNFSDAVADDWLPEEFLGLTPLSRTRGADVTWRIATTLAGKNWFLVGDAAATLDPTSSRGVLKSMMTGMMAGHLAEPVIAGKMGWQQAWSGYGEWLRDWFEKDITQMSSFYGRLEET